MQPVTPFQSVRGTTDLLPEEIARWAKVERAAKRVASLYGYHEIRTPIMEDAALFLRSIGETTDIIQKEMFRFEDRGGHDLVLRPEGTASVVRAYLEHNLHKTQGFVKLFYMGPMFRAERPQAGRLRQFHQYGVEAIGSTSPWLDAEVILLCVRMLQACGVRDLSVWLSSMGCRDDQAKSAALLRERLAPHQSTLCKECQSLFEKNIFRVLDCKHPTCHELAWQFTPPHGAGLTGSPFVLCESCTAHFNQVRQGLQAAGIPYDDTKVFARGLDYYTQTVFEIRAKGLGAQDAVAAGGRYNHLVEELGGPALGAVGFAAGIERLLMAAAHGAAAEQEKPRKGLYLAIAQPSVMDRGFALAHELRQQGVETLLEYEGKSLKAQLREADKAGCQFVAVLGELELQQGTITVKDLQDGAQRTVSLETFAEELSRRVQSTCH